MKQSFNHSIFYITHSKQNNQYLSHLKIAKNWLVLSQEIDKLCPNQIFNPQINNFIQTTIKKLDDLITCIV